MRELLTLKEAASLAGRTTKTIKNYIKQGKITNFFLVEGKYGQEYRINVRDIEPLIKQGKKVRKRPLGLTGEKEINASVINKMAGEFISPEDIYERPEYKFLLRRNDEMLMEVGRCREQVKNLKRTTLELRQELEEKNMLIAMLMKKEQGS